MNPTIQILHLEDDASDAELVREMLRVAGISCEVARVASRSDFVAALEHSGWDVILADYALPEFDGLSALKMAVEKTPRTPFIFVTGTLGEEVAVETLKGGATDYVLKDRLERLVRRSTGPCAKWRNTTGAVRLRRRSGAAKNTPAENGKGLRRSVYGCRKSSCRMSRTNCARRLHPSTSSQPCCSTALPVNSRLKRGSTSKSS